MKRDLVPLQVTSLDLTTLPRTSLGRWGTCLLARIDPTGLPPNEPRVLHVINAIDGGEAGDPTAGEGTVTLTLVSPFAGPHQGWTMTVPRAVLGLVVSDEETSTASAASRSWVPFVLAGEGPVDLSTVWTVSITEAVVQSALPGWIGAPGRAMRNSGWGVVGSDATLATPAPAKTRTGQALGGNLRGWEEAPQRVAANLWWTAIASVVTGEDNGWNRLLDVAGAVERSRKGYPNQMMDAYVGWMLKQGDVALDVSHREAPEVTLRTPAANDTYGYGWALLPDFPNGFRVPHEAIVDAADGVRLERIVARHGAASAITATAVVLTARLRAATLASTTDGPVTVRLARWLSPPNVQIGWEAEAVLLPLVQFEVKAAVNTMMTTDFARLRVWLHVMLTRLWTYQRQTNSDPYVISRHLAYVHMRLPAGIPVEDVLMGAGGLLADMPEYNAALSDHVCPFCQAVDLILDGGIPATDVAAAAAWSAPLLADLEAEREELSVGDAAWVTFRRMYIAGWLDEVRQGWDGFMVTGYTCPTLQQHSTLTRRSA